MPLRRPRFTVRRIMIVAVVVALVMGYFHAIDSSLKSKYLWEEAQFNKAISKEEDQSADFAEKLLKTLPRRKDVSPARSGSVQAKAIFLRKAAAYHRAMERKSRIAAYLPWFPVSEFIREPVYPYEEEEATFRIK